MSAPFDEDLPPRTKLLRQLMAGMSLGQMKLKGASVSGLRALMPIMEAYSSREAASVENGDLIGASGLRKGEQEVLRTVGVKAALELMEITSRSHPVYPDAPVYQSVGVNGDRQAPHLMHLLSIGRAAQDFFSTNEHDDGKPGAEPVEESLSLPLDRSYAYVAIAPGEYELRSEPLTPLEIRRSAMIERNSRQPVLAMRASSSDPTLVPAEPVARSALLQRQMAAPQALQGGDCCQHYKTCACTQCCSGCIGQHCASTDACPTAKPPPFHPARYTDEGECESIFQVSCETKWRIRECFKVAFCDLLCCVGEQMCDDGQLQDAQLGDCLESFVCSFITCLPGAICPPEAPACKPTGCSTSQPTPPKSVCGCNFAVSD